jgi:hypothetical protein
MAVKRKTSLSSGSKAVKRKTKFIAKPKIKTYRVKAGFAPIDIFIPETRRDISLSVREEIMPPLSEEEFRSSVIQRLLDRGRIRLIA